MLQVLGKEFIEGSLELRASSYELRAKRGILLFESLSPKARSSRLEARGLFVS